MSCRCYEPEKQVDSGRREIGFDCPLELYRIYRLTLHNERYRRARDKELDDMIDTSILGDGED